MISLLLFTLLFLTPYVIFPLGITPFEIPKVLVSEILLLVSIALFSLSLPKEKVRDLFSSQTKLTRLALGGILFIILCSFLFFPSPSVLLGTAFRLQGVFLLVLFLGLFFLAQKNKLPSFSSNVLLILLLVQFIASLFISGRIDERSIGTLGEPNALSAFVIFLWPWIISIKEKNLWKKVGVVLLSLIIILLTGSRSGLLAFVLQGIFLLCMSKLSISKAIIITLCLLVVSHTFPFFETKSIYENRAEIWKVALTSGIDSPLIGQGIGNIQQVIETNARSVIEMKYINLDSSHHFLLDWFVQGGVIGVISILALLYQAIKQFIEKKQTAYFLMLLGIITCMCFNPVSVVTLTAFWYLLGVSLTKEEIMV